VTASGVTRIVERLERAGLATRSRSPLDERRTLVRITDAGLDLLAQATSFHLEGVRRLFIDRLTVEQREQLAAIFDHLRAHPPAQGPQPRGRGRA
jgi:DNA-binding MarR family transcriptional regulator